MTENIAQVPDIFISLSRTVFAFLRKSPEHEKSDSELASVDSLNRTAKIRCPICRWSPDSSSRWTCWDCGHPEYFYGGCGTEWNTFDTGGICPTCSHQWIWTSCLSCWGWSKHANWYADSDGEK